jgi:hypothetical protein
MPGILARILVANDPPDFLRDFHRNTLPDYLLYLVTTATQEGGFLCRCLVLLV